MANEVQPSLKTRPIKFLMGRFNAITTPPTLQTRGTDMTKAPHTLAKIMPHKDLTSAAELAGTPVLPPRAMTLAAWAARYMDAQVIGVQAANTVSAKKKDLTAFLKWFYEHYGHLVAEEWLPRDTQGFLDALERDGRAATSINRTFATLRHFARWVQNQPVCPFVAGLPTQGVKELETQEPDAKKLGTREINRLFKAADLLIVTEVRKNARPRRNRAILALLYYTGLRVSELSALRRDQYTGRHLVNVKRKGRSRAREIYISKTCRQYLDDYLATERTGDDPEGAAPWLVLSSRGQKPLNRRTIGRVLMRLAQETTKHNQEELRIWPHRLRHTFGFEVRKRTGSDTETAAMLGHSGLKYVGRYVRATDKEREAILDDL